MKVEDKFEVHGYTLDYYVNRKYMGNMRIDQADRTDYGYGGRKTETLLDTIVLSNGKKIKQGTEVITECSPICGRLKQEQHWGIDATHYSNKALLQLLNANDTFVHKVVDSDSWKDVELLISAKLKLKCTQEQLAYVCKWYENKTK